MTTEPASALFYGIFPSIGAICKSDPEMAKQVQAAFIKVEKNAPGFSNDFLEKIHSRANEVKPAQFNYDATLLALSSQKLGLFQLNLDKSVSQPL